ncbi:MAG: DUF4440 domain-containing protein [Parvularculaceae bacterium]
MMRLVVSVCAMGALLVAPAFAMHHEKDEEAVRKTIADANNVWLACDTEAWGKYDAEDRSAMYPDSLDLQYDINDSKAREIEFCKNGGKHELTNYKIEKVMVKGDVAIAAGSGHYKQTYGDGTSPINADFNFTDVLFRSKDGWKFKHSHIGVVMPPPEAEMTDE